MRDENYSEDDPKPEDQEMSEDEKEELEMDMDEKDEDIYEEKVQLNLKKMA